MSKFPQKINHATAKDVAEIINKPDSKGGKNYSPRYIQMVWEGDRHNPKVKVITEQYLTGKEKLKEKLATA